RLVDDDDSRRPEAIARIEVPAFEKRDAHRPEVVGADRLCLGMKQLVALDGGLADDREGAAVHLVAERQIAYERGGVDAGRRANALEQRVEERDAALRRLVSGIRERDPRRHDASRLEAR